MKAWSKTRSAAICAQDRSGLFIHPLPATRIWVGRGSFEVLVSARVILGNQNAPVGLETLRSMFAVLNSGHLTPSSDHPNDFEPLTPNNFLLQQRNLAPPPELFLSKDLYRRKQWERAQYLPDCFWKRWIQEYIPALQ